MEYKTSTKHENGNDANRLLADGFTCQACNHHLPIEFNVRTEGLCYLCDPNITLEECLSDEPLERVPKAIS